MARNFTKEENSFLECANWGEGVFIDNSSTAKISSTWICIVNSILAIHGVLLNGLIVTVYYKERRLRTISNVLMLALAMADLFVGLLGQPVAIVIHGLKIYDIHRCSLELLSFTLAELGIGFSSTTVCFVIPLERFFAILFPLKHRTLVTKSRLKKVIVILSLFIVPGSIAFVYFLPLHYFFTTQLFVIFSGIAVVAIVYLRIFLLVRKRTKSGQSFQVAIRDNSAPPTRHLNEQIQNSPCTSNTWNVCKKITPSDNTPQHTSNDCLAFQKAVQRFKKEKRILKSMVIIFGALVICFIPRVVAILCMVHGTVAVPMFFNYLVPWTDVMCYSNSSLNPYIYFFRNKDISEAAKRILFGRSRPRQIERQLMKEQPKL